MESTPTRLIELSEALKAHLPVLFSFTVLRWLVWSSTACVCAPCIPRGWTDALTRWRRAAVALGTLLVFGVTARNPPAFDVCASYAHQRGQGATALFAILVLIGSNRWLSTGLAVAALKGVADLSATSVPLALMAGHAAALTQNELLCYLLFTGYTSAHAAACHDPRPHRTHPLYRARHARAVRAPRHQRLARVLLLPLSLAQSTTSGACRPGRDALATGITGGHAASQAALDAAGAAAAVGRTGCVTSTHSTPLVHRLVAVELHHLLGPRRLGRRQAELGRRPVAARGVVVLLLKVAAARG